MYCQGSNCPHLFLPLITPTIIFIHTTLLLGLDTGHNQNTIFYFSRSLINTHQINSSLDCKYIKQSPDRVTRSIANILYFYKYFFFLNSKTIYRPQDWATFSSFWVKRQGDFKVITAGTLSCAGPLAMDVWLCDSVTCRVWCSSVTTAWLRPGCESIRREAPICHQNDKYYVCIISTIMLYIHRTLFSGSGFLFIRRRRAGPH